MKLHASPLEKQVVKEDLEVVPLVCAVNQASHLKEEFELQL